MRIESSTNAQIKSVAALQKKAKERKETGCFVVEGIRMVLEAPIDRLKAVYVSDSFLEREGRDRLAGISYTEVSDQAFRAMSDTKTPQGILAVVRQKEWEPSVFYKKEHALLMILENLQDPGNLGTIIRAGEGAGVTGVIMSKETVDVYNPKVIRSTMGSIYRVPFMVAEDLSQVISECKKHGIQTFAAHLNGKKNYEDYSFKSSTAFMIGNEAAGLSEELSSQADELLKIPMAGQVESLNAAIAASVFMFETARQRRH